ncbi:hypothetical protein, variant [Loa loa]|uniref:EIPR1-like beta-propeller domain-containing protein n=1 Tax=Loa loa TaxID=7209 RepID=A0A1S0UHK9_LOALO|nr:hypothetical protein, variant [Loa loa]EJD75065.1 hypothetical protein, variant [Loa loa]
MTEPLSLMYGIDLPARSIVGLPAEQERTLFLVGTLSLKQDNQVCLLEVDDDWLQITKRSFNHLAGEIWCISSSSVDPNIIATCYVASRSGVGLWKLNDDESNLIDLAQYESPLKSGRCISAEFHPSGNKMAIAVNNFVLLADVSNSLKIENSTSVDSKAPISASVWSPHSNGSTLAIAYDASVKGIDIRSLQEAFCIEHVNSPRVRNLDFNPNMQHIVATCGDDFRVALWDMRKVNTPLKFLQDHSHCYYIINNS